MKARKVKILFINVVNPDRGIETLYPPLGPAYLASYINKYLDKNKFDFKLINSDEMEKIKRLETDVVCITSVSQNFNRAKNVAKVCKSMGIKNVLIGGCHISLCPNSLDKNMDIGVIREGEETFLELMKIFLRKGKFLKSDLLKIKGIIYWDDDKVKINPKRDLITPLDKIPFPDRSLFKINPNKAYIFSSRGCPYRCIFCASSRLWEKTRFFSADYVFKEIKEMVNKYEVKRIDFYDDLFIADKQRMKVLADLMEKSGLSRKAEFNVTGRANLIDDEVCLLLKRISVKGVSMGLESGSPQILKYLKGDSVTVEDNFRAVETIKRHNLYCSGSFIIGSPPDTRKTILETLDFIKKSKLDEFAVFSLTPFPGTPVWEYAESKKLISGNPEGINWNSIDVDFSRAHDRNVHLSKNLSRQELYDLYLLFEKEKRKRNIKRAIKLLYTNPKRFVYHIDRLLKNLVLKIK